MVIAATYLPALSAQAQVIPASRDFSSGWRHAGIEGDIPTPNRIISVRNYGVLGLGLTNEQTGIQNAINALGGTGGVVYFPAGSYIINSSLTIKSNVVLRGERSFNTQIVITNVPAGEVHGINIIQNSQTGKWIDIESGYDLHSSILTLTNVSSFAAGCWVEIHEGTNSAWKMSSWPDMIGQIVQVTEVTSTTPPAGTVRLASPLRIQCEPSLPLYGVLIPPQIRRIVPIENAGLENLHITRTVAGTADTRDNTYSVGFRFAVHCWVRGCEFSNSFGAALGLDYSANCEFTGNYIHDAYEFDGGGSGYGVCFTYRTSEILTENNIFKRLRHSMLVQGGSNGNVLGYNYSREQYKYEYYIGSTLVADMVCHGNYTYANLFEGNCAAYADVDTSHGMNGPYNTFFRNRARGASTQAMVVNDTLCSNQTFVGNECVGAYSLGSKGPFAHGNNDDGTIKPTGTTNLPDYSYYLGTNVTSMPPKPSWWNIPGFIPTYGPTSNGTVPPIGTERDIPARVRWNAGAPYTYGPPSIAAQPTNCGVNAGQAAAFTVTATGTPRAIFQWYKDGLAIPSGTNAVLSLAPAAMSDAGTYRALVTDSNGLMWSANATLIVNQVFVQLITSGSPQPRGTPLPYGYGTQNVSAATWVTNTIDPEIYAGTETRHVCTGWVGSGSIPVAGNSNTVTAQIVSASSLTWRWMTQFHLVTEVEGHGTVSDGGWVGSGSRVTITALPQAPRIFVEWSGDVPEQDRHRNPLELLMDQPRAIRAHFAPAHETGALMLWYGGE
jgi:hypothetical protein